MTAKLKNGILLIRFTDIIIGNRLEQSRAERERERESWRILIAQTSKAIVIDFCRSNLSILLSILN